MVKTLSALEVRKRFGSVLDLVTSKRIPVTICRANKPLAVLVPAEEYHSKSSGREHRLRLTAEHIAEWKRRHQRELRKIDTTKLLREAREQR